MNQLPVKARIIFNILKDEQTGLYIQEIATKTNMTRQLVTYYLFGWVDKKTNRKMGGQLSCLITIDRIEGLNKFIKLKSMVVE